jgi:hypothetical protein
MSNFTQDKKHTYISKVSRRLTDETMKENKYGGELPRLVFFLHTSYYKSVVGRDSELDLYNPEHFQSITRFLDNLRDVYGRSRKIDFNLLVGHFKTIWSYYWGRRTKMRYGINSVRDNWVFSRNAIVLVKAGKVKTSGQVEKRIRSVQFSLRRNVNLPSINQLLLSYQKGAHLGIQLPPEEYLRLIPFEESGKSRFQGEDRFKFCQSNTTLFHPKSRHCNSCPFKDKCISNQKRLEAVIYRNRTMQYSDGTTA